MNLLIVEDEIRLRNSLAYHIPWEEHDIEVVGMAANGLEALQLVERKMPDIVILDIQMPEMDGLTLARLVHERDKYINIIILTGHDDFSYTQAAVELGIFKYLLKPAGESEILQTVLEAAQQYRNDLAERQNQASLRDKWHCHLPCLQNNFLLNVLRGHYVPEQIWSLNAELGVHLERDYRYAAVVIDLDEYPNIERESKGDAATLQFKLTNVVEQLLLDEQCWISVSRQGAVNVMFPIRFEEDENKAMLRIHTIVSKLLSNIGICLNMMASAGICGTIGPIEQLGKSYEEACAALQKRQIYGGGIAIPYQVLETALPSHEVLELCSEKELEMALLTGDRDKAIHVFTTVWEQALDKLDSLELMQEQVMYLCSIFIIVIRKQGWMVKEVTDEHFVFLQNIHVGTTREQIYGSLRGTVESIIAYTELSGKAVNHRTIRTILDMIEEGLQEELTLHMIADRLFVNASYLSRLFKQETGKSFSTYVLERKMERAKQLLLNGALVYGVANQVGYRDVSYFTKVFRKYWGITPGSVKA
ncbi:response regulator [Paenibacillus sp. 481]|nr:response regulator [Paenibacillus sp. 481]